MPIFFILNKTDILKTLFLTLKHLKRKAKMFLLISNTYHRHKTPSLEWKKNSDGF